MKVSNRARLPINYDIKPRLLEQDFRAVLVPKLPYDVHLLILNILMKRSWFDAMSYKKALFGHF